MIRFIGGGVIGLIVAVGVVWLTGWPASPISDEAWGGAMACLGLFAGGLWDLGVDR